MPLKSPWRWIEILLTRTKTMLLAACSVLALTVPAASAVADNGVARGHVLEFAKLTTITGSAGNDGSEFRKVFATRQRSHVIATDNATGALKYETSTSPRIVRTYVASENTLYLRDGTSSPEEQTPAEEARYFQQGVDEGCFVKLGSHDGLDHYRMIDRPQVPCSDSPDTKVDALVEQRFGFVVSRVTTNGGFRQDESLAYTKDHTEPGRLALLKLGQHPGAQVVDERS
jgi:hypothetical protein